MNDTRQAMKSAIDPDNFRPCLCNHHTAREGGIQIIPLSEVAAKDKFLNISNMSRDNMMAAHRVPPQMMGIIPNNIGGVEKASMVFVRNELIPLQKRFEGINEWTGEAIMSFKKYELN